MPSPLYITPRGYFRGDKIVALLTPKEEESEAAHRKAPDCILVPELSLGRLSGRPLPPTSEIHKARTPFLLIIDFDQQGQRQKESHHSPYDLVIIFFGISLCQEQEHRYDVNS
jgi:hypothetical protein